MNVLSLSALAAFAWYVRRRLPSLPAWLVYGWLLTASWTLNFSTHVVNVSYLLPAGIVFFIGFLEAVPAMRAAVDGIAAAEITQASRSATVDGVDVAEGDYLALLGGRAFATGDDIWTVLDALLARFATDGQSFVQVLRGDGAPEADEIAARYADGLTGLEIDVQWGGQPHYPLLLSAE